ncbi:hypothetical protein M2323_001201 [Rhodoblastus acidophilus]|uniref:hypothetical protein n=1 Tax=Rhodoblastus acidophilus TaxID=1074 RepID=UPI00222483EC|nr:hypothetical protein [Rhodoblastus acidophilus]MCW2283385.1 hypothetical protein [Rhodoblastus acidophilus]MCW2332291.1 hypothetical protein [Rhodoblastus acidophilus]
MTMIIRFIVASIFVSTAAFAAGMGSNRVLGVSEGGTGTPSGPAAVPFIAPGGVSSASALSRAGHHLNVIDDFGAKGDGQWPYLAVTCQAGSATISFASATWSSKTYTPVFSGADVGKIIAVPGCGGTWLAYGPVTVSSAGSSYVYGAIITLNGGTGPEPIKVMVTATTASDGVSAGGVASAVLYNPGIFTTTPSGVLSQASTNGTGTGATFAAPNFTSVLSATIKAVNSASSVTLSTSAAASQTGVAQFVTYGHDDQPAFASALSAMIVNPTRGSRLYVPTPPGQGYLFGSQLSLIGASATPYDYENAVTIEGDGRASTIRAAAVMDSVIQKDAVWSRGYRVAGLQIDAAAMAIHGVSILNGQNNYIDHNWITNAAPGGSNVLLAQGGTGAGTDTVSDNYILNDSAVIPDLAHMPTFALDVESPDNNIMFNFMVNGSYCQVYDGGSNNHFVTNHGYAIPSAFYAPYNMCARGASTWVGNTSGGGTTVAGYYVTGYASHLTGNHAQGDPIGYLVASGVQDAHLVGNWADEGSVPIAVQQNGAPGVNTVVAANTGLQPVYQNYNGGFYSGIGQHVKGGASGPLGWLGSYGYVNGQGNFALGSGIDDHYRKGCFIRSSVGTNGWNGDSQVVDCVMYGSGTSAANITSTGNMPPGGVNEIFVPINIPFSEDVTVKLHAYCSTQDYGYWTVNFGLIANKSAAGVQFEGASGPTTTPPTFTSVRKSTGAASWTPSVVLDTTNGGAYLTGTGTCTGGKTIYWVADVHIVETGAGAN